MSDDIKTAIKKLSETIRRCRERVSNEEGTKHTFILPFLRNVLGYDPEDPYEVMPEYVADIRSKAGEKVDYAIMRGEKPIMLVECKHWEVQLGAVEEGQLKSYFAAVDGEKFAVLTNGIEYRFYSDFDATNKMDKEPFFVFSMEEPEKIDYDELEKFSKWKFDVITIRKNAYELKNRKAIRDAIKKTLEGPSEEFVNMVFRQISPRKKFGEKTKESFTQLVREAISDTIKIEDSDAQETTNQTSKRIEKPQSSDCEILMPKEEKDGYNEIKKFLYGIVPADKITMKSMKNYCTIDCENAKGKKKTICRFYFKFKRPQKWRMGICDETPERMVSIESVEQIKNYADSIIAAAKKCL